MPATVVLAFALLAGSESDCASAAACNALGSKALQAGDIKRAQQIFALQVDYAETAQKLAEVDADLTRLAHAREIAVNNAALAALRAGDCPRARAWLEAADPAHKATAANRRQLDARCAGQLDGLQHTGEFWQYAGHGVWNTVSIRPTGDETLRLDAFWMRIGRGPLNEWGPAAFGNLEQVYLHVDGQRARGEFEGIDPEAGCEVRVTWAPGGLDIEHTALDECRLGGAGADLHGRYWRVGEESPLPEDTE